MKEKSLNQTRWVIVHKPNDADVEHMTMSAYSYSRRNYRQIIKALKTMYFIFS